MNKELEFVFKNVVDWLKFAEAKNAALLAFNTGVIFGLLKLEQLPGFESPWFKCYASFVLVALLVSALVCLLSFVPQLRIPWLYREKKRPHAVQNILFFGHIYNLTAGEFLQLLSLKSGHAIPQNAGYFEDMANQIIVNSKRALQKYKLFSMATWLTICALFSPLPALLLYVMTE